MHVITRLKFYIKALDWENTNSLHIRPAELLDLLKYCETRMGTSHAGRPAAAMKCPVPMRL